MDGIKKYDGSICKEGYYRFQTRSWFDLGRMRATANAEQCFALVEELRISGKHERKVWLQQVNLPENGRKSFCGRCQSCRCIRKTG